MKSKVIAALVATIIFVAILFSLGLINSKDRAIEQKKVDVEKVDEGETCGPPEGRVCKSNFTCKEGVCFPRIDYKEIINPKEDKDFYRVALAGPYKKDYILHVDRLVISENLYVWIGDKNKPYWFKARREKELRPYEIKVPKGNRIRINLMNQEKKVTPEFRGKIYLTAP